MSNLVITKDIEEHVDNLVLLIKKSSPKKEDIENDYKWIGFLLTKQLENRSWGNLNYEEIKSSLVITHQIEMLTHKSLESYQKNYRYDDEINLEIGHILVNQMIVSQLENENKQEEKKIVNNVLFITSQIDDLINKCLYYKEDDYISIGFLLANQKYLIKYDKPNYNKQRKNIVISPSVITPQLELLTDQALQYFENKGTDNHSLYSEIGHILVNQRNCSQFSNKSLFELNKSPFEFSDRPVFGSIFEKSTVDFDKVEFDHKYYQVNPKFGSIDNIEFLDKPFFNFPTFDLSLNNDIEKLIDENVKFVKTNGTVDESKCIQIGRLLTDQKLQFLKEKEMMEKKRKEEKKQQKMKELNNILKDLKLSGLNIRRINDLIENKGLRRLRSESFDDHLVEREMLRLNRLNKKKLRRTDSQQNQQNQQNDLDFTFVNKLDENVNFNYFDEKN